MRKRGQGPRTGRPTGRPAGRPSVNLKFLALSLYLLAAAGLLRFNRHAISRLDLSFQESAPPELRPRPPSSARIRRVFVNYAFCETADDRLDNLRFFLRHGVVAPRSSIGLTVHYGLVVNGECGDPACDGAGWDENAPLRILKRGNVGFDFGQHAAMLEELDRDVLTYDAYIFLNAGVLGPFVPAYMPPGWHWTMAFTDKLVGNVGVVSTSIVCLPEKDLGGYGPKVEAFAFAMTRESLRVVREHGTSFTQHRNKKKAIIEGEYALTKTIFEHGMTIDSLLLAYSGVKWDPSMSCNDLKHPTRPKSYFGITVHPLETLFHKNVWEKYGPVMDNGVLRTYEEFVDGKHRPPEVEGG